MDSSSAPLNGRAQSSDWHLHLPAQYGQVVGDILTERSLQDGKWGEQNHDPFTWIAILGEEYGEFCQEALKHRFGDGTNREELRQELVQVAAVAFAMIQCLDRGKWNWPSHTEIIYDQPTVEFTD